LDSGRPPIYLRLYKPPVSEPSKRQKPSPEVSSKYDDIMTETIMPNPDAPPLLGQDHVLDHLNQWGDALRHPDAYPIPRLVLFGGGSGVGKGTAVKLLAKETGCKLFFPPPCFFAKDLTRIPELFRVANETAEDDGRHCIVFLDEVDAILNKASTAKVNTFKGTLENTGRYPNIMIVCATNHFDKLSTDVGASSRTSNRITFNSQTPEVIKQLVEFNFSRISVSHPLAAHTVNMGDDDWATILPSLMGQNGHTLDAWCTNVSSNVTYRHRCKDKEDNLIRLEDMQRETLGLQDVASNPTTVPDVTALSPEDKKDRIKEWLRQTFVPSGYMRDSIAYQRSIDFFGAVVSQKDILPDDILLCAGVKPSDLERVRDNDRMSKALWDKGDASTSLARQQFATCIREVWGAQNHAMMKYITKNQVKNLITRDIDHQNGTEVAGYKNILHGGRSKLEGYFLKGLYFAPQWISGCKMAKCIEWAILLGDDDQSKTPALKHDGCDEQLSGYSPFVQALDDSYPIFDHDSVMKILNWVHCLHENGEGNVQPPELVSVHEMQGRAYGTGTPHVKCTFKHPSGVHVPDIWIDIDEMRKHYSSDQLVVA